MMSRLRATFWIGTALAVWPAVATTAASAQSVGSDGQPLRPGTVSPATASPTAAAPATDVVPVEANQIGDIVVTANKRAQNLQDIPATVQAITSEDLAKAGINDVSRLENISPGLIYAKGGNDAKIAIRGINSNSTFADNTSVVGFFVDGVYKPRASQQTRAFFDVERVEVLRGPQGTLYGRNTLGGAINLYSKAPDLTRSGISFGDDTRFSRFNEVRNEAYVNAGISDQFGLRLAVLTDNSSGWVENSVGRNLGIQDTLSLRGSARYKPSSGTDIVLRVTHIQENGNPAGMFAINGACRTVDANGLTDPFGPVRDCQNPRRGSGGTPRFDLIDGVPGLSNYDKRHVQRDFVNNDRLREDNASLDIGVDLGPVTLKSISSYTNYRSLLGNDADYSANNNGREWVEENNKSYSQEVQLISKWGGPLQLTVGGYGSSTLR